MKTIQIQEEKYIKRIGYVQYLDRDLLRKTFPDFMRLFDHNVMNPAERRRLFERLGIVKTEHIFENITPISGFQQILKGFVGDLTDLEDLVINVHALGTGTNTPANGDTALQTETYRKLVTSKSYSDNKGLYTIFYDSAEAPGSYEEMGLYMGADENVADDGTLYDRTLYNFTKAGDQDVTFDYEDLFVNG